VEDICRQTGVELLWDEQTMRAKGVDLSDIKLVLFRRSNASAWSILCDLRGFYSEVDKMTLIRFRNQLIVTAGDDAASFQERRVYSLDNLLDEQERFSQLIAKADPQRALRLAKNSREARRKGAVDRLANIAVECVDPLTRTGAPPARITRHLDKLLVDDLPVGHSQLQTLLAGLSDHWHNPSPPKNGSQP
jgi:hypothetical protein